MIRVEGGERGGVEKYVSCDEMRSRLRFPPKIKL